ncbi:MAG: CopG family transcriptional regulator [Propioniciclava sp.]|uniref:ribbon-helix-helix domain-containing protein n=1 Tax=Propioniciclava sp. TaxID=2038686 RepID=UPI0039E5678D
MSLTSIKVSKELRDRVSRLAHDRGMSQHAYLDQLLREAEERDFWARMADTGADEYRAALAEDGDQLGDDYDDEESLIRAEER